MRRLQLPHLAMPAHSFDSEAKTECGVRFWWFCSIRISRHAVGRAPDPATTTAIPEPKNIIAPQPFDDRPRGRYPTAYVSREVGAAKLQISPETWDRWAYEGILPPVAPGFPVFSTPRCKWTDIDRKLSGRRKSQGGTIGAAWAEEVVCGSNVSFRGSDHCRRMRRATAPHTLLTRRCLVPSPLVQRPLSRPSARCFRGR